jgi:hypothetical protein
VPAGVDKNRTFRIIPDPARVAKLVAPAGITDTGYQHIHTSHQFGIAAAQAPILDIVTGMHYRRPEG